MASNLDLTVLNLQAALLVERLKNCQLLHQALSRQEEDLQIELSVVREEIAKLTPKPNEAHGDKT